MSQCILHKSRCEGEKGLRAESLKGGTPLRGKFERKDGKLLEEYVVHTTSKALATIGEPAPCSLVSPKFLLSLSIRVGSAAASCFVFRNPKFSSRSDPLFLTSWYNTVIQISYLVMHDYGPAGRRQRWIFSFFDMDIS